jgi:cell division septation protein DedD
MIRAPTDDDVRYVPDMAEVSKNARKGSYALTGGHLLALFALAVSLAALSFFVGYDTGKTQVRVVEVQSPTKPLIGDEARTGDLETLLGRVEQANGRQGLAFPNELPASAEPVAPAVGPDGAPLPVTAPARPSDPFPDAQRPGAAEVTARAPMVAVAPDANVPSGGWAIEVATFSAEAEAAAHAESLRAQDLAAYRVVALVDGATAWRVRVGGYASKDAASAALASVGTTARADAPRVTKAP